MKRFLSGLLAVSFLSVAGCADPDQTGSELTNDQLSADEEDSEYAEQLGGRGNNPWAGLFGDAGFPLGQGGKGGFPFPFPRRDGGIFGGFPPGGGRPGGGFPGFPGRDGGIGFPGGGRPGGGFPGFPGRDGGIGFPGGGGFPGFPGGGFPGLPGRDGGTAFPGGGGNPGFPGFPGLPGRDAGVAQPPVQPDEPDQPGDTDPPDEPSDPGPSDACASLSYESFGKQFMQQYCTTCHQGASAPGGVDLTSLDKIKAKKDHVEEHAVTSQEMPPAGLPAPSAAQREQLGKWLDCGPN